MGNTFITDTQIRTDNIVNSDGTGSPAFPLGISVSGATQFGNGTSSAPSITFTSNTGLGLFRKAANALGFASNSLEAGSYDGSARWIIGHTSSASHLIQLAAAGSLVIGKDVVPTNYVDGSRNLLVGTNDTTTTSVVGLLGYRTAAGEEYARITFNNDVNTESLRRGFQLRAKRGTTNELTTFEFAQWNGTSTLVRGSISESGLWTFSAGLSVSGGSVTLPATVDYTGNGSIVKSGNHALTLTTTAASNITFPLSGTLATLAGTENLSNKTFTNATTFQAAVSTNAGHRGGWGLVPVGGIIAYNPGHYTDASNNGFTIAGPAGNTVAQINTYLNAQGWYVCDGAIPNQVGTPIWDNGTKRLPNLTGSRFLMGSTTAGTFLNNSNTVSIAHDHTFAHTHGTDSQLGTISLSHGHTVNSHRHDFRFALNDFNYGPAGAGAGMGSANQAGAFRYSTGTYQGANGTGILFSTQTGNPTASGVVSVDRYVTTGDTDVSSPGTDTQLTNYNAGHSHSTTSQNTSTTGSSSVTSVSVLPQYLSTYFIIRVF